MAVRSILAVLLDYLSIAVFFCLIYLLFALVTNGKGLKGLRNPFGSDDDDSTGRDSSGRTRRSKKPENEADNGGNGSGPEDTSSEYGDWADGFANVSVWVTDEDDNPIQGAIVTVKHRKIHKMSRRMRGPTGPKGTYGPKKIPAGPIMVKANHRNWVQLGIWAGAGYLIGGALAIAGKSLGSIGALVGAAQFFGDRYAMKDWFILEKGTDEVLHIRLKRKKGQPDHAFEPFIRDVVLREQQADGREKSRLVGEVHIESHNPQKYGGTRGRDY